MNVIAQRARNAMIGLAIGDAIGWPAMFHRAALLPPWPRRLRREMDAASEASKLLTVAMPFSLNQPPEVFNVSPTDDAEWAAHTAMILLQRDQAFEEATRRAWVSLSASQESVKGGVSTQAALRNIRAGILPPRSGRENPHYIDDGALCRAVPIGIACAGDPLRAAQRSALDASVTNAEDGIWAAQAMAVAVCLACAGKGATESIGAAMGALPEGSLIRRVVEEARLAAGGSGSLFSLLPVLQDRFVNQEYSYGNAAPETLALAFVIAQAPGMDFERAVLTAASFAKTADSLPAAVGALVGALSPGEIASDAWLGAVRTLKGIAIPSLAGTDYVELSTRLAATAGEAR